MAFVYRSPRHIEKTIQIDPISNQSEESNKENRTPQLKKPMKGFAHHRSE